VLRVDGGALDDRQDVPLDAFAADVGAMATAGVSWGTVTGRGSAWPAAKRLAYASMSGAKSVPALAKRYSTPRAASSSRYASAVDSIAIFLLMRVSPRRGDGRRA